MTVKSDISKISRTPSRSKSSSSTNKIVAITNLYVSCTFN